MAGKLSPAQRANQITYFLKGDLKNLRVAYLRAGAKLAKRRGLPASELLQVAIRAEVRRRQLSLEADRRPA